MNRRTFLKAAGLAAASLAFKGCDTPQTARSPKLAIDRPNIIFIIVDDMGYADLGCYGSRAVQTPNIDRMASEGVRFTDAYSGCTVCAPARCVLMTGLHSGHTSVRGNTGGISLQKNDVTVAQVLKQRGYVTGGFGKWGLGDAYTPGVPEKHGFDEFFGYLHQIHAHDYYTEYLWHNGRKVPMTGEKGSAERYSHYRIFDRMIDFLKANKDRPFFCYAPWTPPHGDYVIPDTDPAVAIYKDKPWSDNAKVVAAMDSMIDRQVGQIMDLLKELELDERTIVFFCSDNGAANRFEGQLDSGGPFRGGKRSMYEGGIRVPLVVRWPGVIDGNRVSSHPCYFADVMPTLAEIAGALRFMPDIDGLSIVPTLTGDTPQPEHEFMYWELHPYDWGKRQYSADGLVQAVRMGRYKAVRQKSMAPWELYDLSADIGETTDIASDHPDIIAKIEQYIKTHRVEPPRQVEPDMPPGKSFR